MPSDADIEPSDYDGYGDLPDALAFVKPNRARFWIHLERYDEPVTTAELDDEVDCSKPTIYRMLNDLEEIGLAETLRGYANGSPTTMYQTVEPGEEEEALVP